MTVVVRVRTCPQTNEEVVRLDVRLDVRQDVERNLTLTSFGCARFQKWEAVCWGLHWGAHSYPSRSLLARQSGHPISPLARHQKLGKGYRNLLFVAIGLGAAVLL